MVAKRGHLLLSINVILLFTRADRMLQRIKPFKTKVGPIFENRKFKSDVPLKKMCVIKTFEMDCFMSFPLSKPERHFPLLRSCRARA